jgi:hypothetical protein
VGGGYNTSLASNNRALHGSKTYGKEKENKMKLIGILLLVVGGIGLVMGGMMFGDIGMAAWIGSVAALLSGIGFLKLNKTLGTSPNKVG